MEKLLDDLKYGFRNLKANPTFSFIAVLTLALGIGITTAMYTLVNNVLLKPLPFPNPEQLVMVGTLNKKQNNYNSAVSIDIFKQLEAEKSPLQAMSYWAFNQATLARGDQQKPLTLMMTSPNFLAVFGTRPHIGRWYGADDLNTQTVLISYQVWEEDFNADPDILSRIIKLNNQDFQVLGVMPPNFSGSGYTSVDLWMPIDKLDRPVNLMGRLKAGLTVEQAKQQSTALQSIINAVSGDTENIWEIQYTLMLDTIIRDTKSSLYLLLASVFAVFLIAILNVVNLTFAQYTNRTQELAVRVSVGASRGRLLRQLLTESLLLCSVGGAIGLLLSAWTLEWIRELMGSRIPRLYEVSIDQNTMLAVVALICVSTIATTLVPAYTIVSPNKLANAIKQAGRKVTGDKRSQRIRRMLVSSEVCVAVVLLICAGLLMRSYVQLTKQPTGFDSTNIVTGHIWLADNFQPQPSQSSYWLRVAEALKQHPDVIEVAATSTMPMSRTGIDYPVSYAYPGAPAVPRGEEPTASVRSITEGYFSLLSIPMIDGRDFDFRDTADSPKVVIINQQLAESAWPKQKAVGNILSLPAWMGGDHQVIGVVGNVKHRGLRAIPNEEFFLPVTQHSYPGMSFLVKTQSENFSAMENVMLQTSIKLEATAPMVSLEPLASLAQSSVVSEKLLLIVLGVFAAIALLLASIGVYGISDNMVSQRTNEIGIRMAIGARPGVIRRWIIRDTARPVIFGALIGSILAFILAQLLASLLYGVNAFDPVTFIAVPVTLLLVGVIATWIPAKRATKVHPQQALHYE